MAARTALVRGLLPAAILIALVPAAGGAPRSESTTRVAYSLGGTIRIVAADGSGSRLVAGGEAPSWSPDGRGLAFQSARGPGGDLDIWVTSADGSNQRRLVTHPTGLGDVEDNSRDDFDPAWSPSAGTIAFVTNRDGNDEIYSMDTIGHSLARLTSSPASDREPAWSPDGERIAFVTDRDGNDEIYVMGAGANDVRRLTRDSAADRAPTWSPDGRSIAFASSRDGNSEIYVMGSDGTAPRRLTDDPAADTNPSWSPDGRLLVFTRSTAAGARLVVMSASGGSARTLAASGDRASWAPAVDLALSVRAGRAIRTGRPTRVRIALRDLIPFPASSVVVSGSISAGGAIVRARSTVGSCSGTRAFTCRVRSLGGARTFFVDLTLRASRCGRLDVWASVASLQPDLRPTDNRAHARLQVRC